MHACTETHIPKQYAPATSWGHKYQGPSSNTFRDILLTRFHCEKNAKKAITPLIFYGICSKVNQVIYTSTPISIPNIMALAQIVSDISC